LRQNWDTDAEVRESLIWLAANNQVIGETPEFVATMLGNATRDDIRCLARKLGEDTTFVCDTKRENLAFTIILLCVRKDIPAVGLLTDTDEMVAEGAQRIWRICQVAQQSPPAGPDDPVFSGFEAALQSLAETKRENQGNRS
jgi:hypothetical protein